MLFPLIAGLVAVAAAWWLARPLIAANVDLASIPDKGEGARESYRRALADLSADEAAGTISPQNAERERTALARGLLKAEEGVSAGVAPAIRRGVPRAAAFALLAIVPLLGGALYLLAGGALALANRPAQTRAPEIVELERLARGFSERVTRTPDDAEGYRLLAMTLTSLGRSVEALEAYRTAVQMGSKSAETLAALGATLMQLQRGPSKEALDAFDEALARDPDEPTALLFRGQAMLQLGDFEAARKDLAHLLETAPADAPWRENLATHLKALDAQIANAPDQVPEGGAAIASLDPQARQAAIQSMVDGLAARLDASPDDLEGWKKLIRSYTVLGQKDKADAARAKAQAAFKNDPKALGELKE